MSNRHLLLALIGLGGLNALLCLVMVFRENTNGTRIAQLNSELKKTRGDDLAETQRTLADIRALLTETRTELDTARKTIARYDSMPWLNRVGRKAPWQDELERLAARIERLEKALGQMKPLFPKPG